MSGGGGGDALSSTELGEAADMSDKPPNNRAFSGLFDNSLSLWSWLATPELRMGYIPIAGIDWDGFQGTLFHQVFTPQQVGEELANCNIASSSSQHPIMPAVDTVASGATNLDHLQPFSGANCEEQDAYRAAAGRGPEREYSGSLPDLQILLDMDTLSTDLVDCPHSAPDEPAEREFSGPLPDLQALSDLDTLSTGHHDSGNCPHSAPNEPATQQEKKTPRAKTPRKRDAIKRRQQNREASRRHRDGNKTRIEALKLQSQQVKRLQQCVKIVDDHRQQQEGNLIELRQLLLQTRGMHADTTTFETALRHVLTAFLEVDAGFMQRWQAVRWSCEQASQHTQSSEQLLDEHNNSVDDPLMMDPDQLLRDCGMSNKKPRLMLRAPSRSNAQPFKPGGVRRYGAVSA